MKKLLLIGLALAMIFPACSDFVTDVDNLIDLVEDKLLTDEAQIPFVITGIKGRWGGQYAGMTIITSLMSDETLFTQDIPGATYPSYNIYDQNDRFTSNLNYGNSNWRNVARMRWHGENLISRVGEIEFKDQALKKEALFWGNFVAAFARMEYSIWFGLNEEEGGGILSEVVDGVITFGAFIPAAQMYPLAMEWFGRALSNAPDAYTAKWVNTVIARLHLFMGDYSAARTSAAAGLMEGDDPFGRKHDGENSNTWYGAQGWGRTSGAMDPRFYQWVVDDPKEGYVRVGVIDGKLQEKKTHVYIIGDGSGTRIPLWTKEGQGGEVTYYIQEKYGKREDQHDFATWQENELILAELDIRDAINASALTRINKVRASFNLDPKLTADMDLLIDERDKTLFLSGMRLVDQRRFNRWHLPTANQQYKHRGWLYVPIGEAERDQNPNIGFPPG